MGTVFCSTSAITTVGGIRLEASTLRAASLPQPVVNINANAARAAAASETDSLRTCRVFIAYSYRGPALWCPQRGSVPAHPVSGRFRVGFIPRDFIGGGGGACTGKIDSIAVRHSPLLSVCHCGGLG